MKDTVITKQATTVDKINVLFMDDHRMVTNALTALLSKDQRFKVIGETSDAKEAINLARLNRCDIFLVEINLKPVSGIEITKALRKLLPGSKIIGLSIFSLPGYAKKMMQAGAKGYVTKNSSCAELVEAILQVHRGTKYVCREIRDMVAKKYLEPGDEISGINKLTTRELDVIHCIKMGYSSKEIAVRAGLSIKTVEVHRYNILRKLNLRNAASLVNFINLNGL